VIFDVLRIDGDGPFDLFERPFVNVEHTIQDDPGVEDFAQGFGEMSQLVAIL
jgi:hypothetical protein